MDLLASKAKIESDFPGLIGTDYEVTSPRDLGYNCIAWAADCNHRHWWPTINPRSFWPADVPIQENLEAFKKLFEKLGYQECSDSTLEEGYFKIAIFVANGKPTHAARQLENGKWASKLGTIEDIEHIEKGLEGLLYGVIQLFMKRERSIKIACPHS